MGNKSATAASRARRWTTYAACAWCVAFGALHAWWALGIPFGFPGGEASYQVMANSPWRMVVDVIVVVMSVLGFLVVRALMQPAGPGGRALVARALAWAAFALLTLRGAAGLVVDWVRDPIWWPTFLIGGILFGTVAWLERRPVLSAWPRDDAATRRNVRRNTSGDDS